MEFLKDLHNKVSDNGNFKHRRGLIKNIFYNNYVIKAEAIPENYYKHQQEIALERGYGHIEMTDEIRR